MLLSKALRLSNLCMVSYCEIIVQLFDSLLHGIAYIYTHAVKDLKIILNPSVPIYPAVKKKVNLVSLNITERSTFNIVSSTFMLNALYTRIFIRIMLTVLANTTE